MTGPCPVTPSLSADVHSFYRLLHQLLLHKPFLSLFCWQQNVKASLLFELFIIHSSNIKKKIMTHLYSVLLRKYKKKSWCKCIGVFRTAVCNSYNRASQAFTCTDVLTVLSYLLSYLFIICMFWLKPTLRMQMIRPPCRFPKKNNPKLHLVAKNKNKTVNWYCSGVIQILLECK